MGKEREGVKLPSVFQSSGEQVVAGTSGTVGSGLQANKNA